MRRLVSDMKIVKNDKDAVIDENISALDQKQRALFEERLAHLEERLRFAGKPVFDEEDAEAEGGELLTLDKYLSSKKAAALPEGAAEDSEELSYLFKNFDRFDRLFYIGQLARKYPSRIPTLTPKKDDGGMASGIPPAITYVKSRGADDAYLAFAAQLPALPAVYAEDFSAACEAVYYEKSRYAILPLENSADGRLLGFYNLIGRYELKIVYTCDVTDPDGIERSRFALCAKDFEAAEDGDTLCYELYFPSRSGEGLAAILTAAEYYRLTVRRIDSIPADAASDPDKNQVYLTLSGAMADMKILLCYLEAEYAEYTVIGACRSVSA